MARLNPSAPIQPLGSLSNISIYKRRDLDKIIVRTKGGPTKAQIKKLKKFETTRRNNAEFGGRSLGSSWIMLALHQQKNLADYNIAGPLNSLLRVAQQLDTTHEKGKRSILLSQQPNLLAGFDLNRKRSFNSIIRNPLHHTLSKHPSQATIDIPALIPGVTLDVPGNYPMYSFIAMLGEVPNLIYSEFGYKPSVFEVGVAPKETFSDWYPVLSGSPTITLQLNKDQARWSEFTVILSIGIRFGTIGVDGNIQQVKYAGASKILAAI